MKGGKKKKTKKKKKESVGGGVGVVPLTRESLPSIEVPATSLRSRGVPKIKLRRKALWKDAVRPLG